MNYYEELGKINKKIERLQRCKANCGSGGGSGSWLYGDGGGEFSEPTFYNDFFTYESPIFLYGKINEGDGIRVFGNTNDGIGMKLTGEAEIGDGIRVKGKSISAGIGLHLDGEGTDPNSSAVEIHGNNPSGVDILIYLQNNSLKIENVPSYADDTSAGVAGLTAGRIYQTDGSGASPLNVAGILMIKQ